MSPTLSSYLGNLKRLFDAMEIRDAADEPCGIDEGARAAVDLISSAKKGDRKVMVVGNGGSAAIASHAQNDFCKAVGVRSLVFTETPLLTALSNDESYITAYESLVKLWAVEGDILIAISSSGRSENILRAARAARDAGCRVMTMSGFAADNPLRKLGDVNFYVPSGSYGPVEIAHAMLCQFLTDALIKK